MSKFLRKLSLAVGTLAVVGVLATASLASARNVHAETSPSDGTGTTPETSDVADPATTQETEQEQTTPKRPMEEKRQEAVQERKDAAKERLSDAKLHACQNREQAITNIMSRISDRGQKQAELFGTIANRAEAFYTKQGKTLANYDSLVADVVAKQAAAQTAIDAIKGSSDTFHCDGDNPHGVITSFKEGLKSEIAALKAYRTSVKNLIVGIKSVQGTDSKETQA